MGGERETLDLGCCLDTGRLQSLCGLSIFTIDSAGVSILHK